MPYDEILQQLQDLANDHELELLLHDGGRHIQLIGYTETGTKVIANWWPTSRKRTVWIDTTKYKTTNCNLHDFVEQTLEAVAKVNATEPRNPEE